MAWDMAGFSGDGADGYVSALQVTGGPAVPYNETAWNLQKFYWTAGVRALSLRRLAPE